MASGGQGHRDNTVWRPVNKAPNPRGPSYRASCSSSKVWSSTPTHRRPLCEFFRKMLSMPPWQFQDQLFESPWIQHPISAHTVVEVPEEFRGKIRGWYKALTISELYTIPLSHTWFLLNQEINLTLQGSTCQANQVLVPHFERIRINILSQRPTERDLDHHISIMSAPLVNPNEDLGLGWDIESLADLNIGEESVSRSAQPNIPLNISLNILFFNTEGVARPNFLQHYMHLHSSRRFHLVIITNTKKEGSEAQFMSQIMGFPNTKTIAPPPSGMERVRGGFWCLWNEAEISCEVVEIPRNQAIAQQAHIFIRPARTG
ncbi:hypothetical protein CsSME_00049358 [Camellia sinensis var. sinensis]